MAVRAVVLCHDQQTRTLLGSEVHMLERGRVVQSHSRCPVRVLAVLAESEVRFKEGESVHFVACLTFLV